MSSNRVWDFCILVWSLIIFFVLFAINQLLIYLCAQSISVVRLCFDSLSFTFFWLETNCSWAKNSKWCTQVQKEVPQLIAVNLFFCQLALNFVCMITKIVIKYINMELYSKQSCLCNIIYPSNMLEAWKEKGRWVPARLL